MVTDNGGLTLTDIYTLVLHLGLCIMFGLGMISGAQV